MGFLAAKSQLHAATMSEARPQRTIDESPTTAAHCRVTDNEQAIHEAIWGADSSTRSDDDALRSLRPYMLNCGTEIESAILKASRTTDSRTVDGTGSRCFTAAASENSSGNDDSAPASRVLVVLRMEEGLAVTGVSRSVAGTERRLVRSQDRSEFDEHLAELFSCDDHPGIVNITALDSAVCELESMLAHLAGAPGLEIRCASLVIVVDRDECAVKLIGIRSLKDREGHAQLLHGIEELRGCLGGVFAAYS